MCQVLLVLSLLAAQFNVPRITKPEHPQADLGTLPEQRRPDEKTLKAEYARSVEDVGEILRMAAEVKGALEKGDHQSLPADAVRMLGEIEKRARQAKRRLKR